MSSEPRILIVDTEDKPIGAATKEEAWEKGLIHRIAHVIVENEKGEVLLQKRSPNKKLWPDCWTDSASGHVDEGEGWDEAAKRETLEEIGLGNIELEELGTFFQDTVFEGKKLKRFNRVYKARVAADTKFSMQHSELAQLKWFSAKELEELTEKNPKQLTPNIVQIINTYLKHTKA